jgi:glycosyltransferase involved in cell wall biosynthesis
MQVMGSDKRGGAENFFSRLCIALQKKTDITQCVIIRRNAPCMHDLLEGGVKPIEMPFFYSGNIISKLLLKKYINQFTPDIVLTWMSRATSVCSKGSFIWVARFGGYYDLKYYKSCNHLIANTKEIIDYLIKCGWLREKTSYLPNFVDENKSFSIDKASLQTPSDAPVILALGRFHSDKAFDVLINAMSKIPHAHLWLAGEGKLEYKLRAQTISLGIAERVHFLGWRNDIGSLLVTADCLVCPSRIEPLGNVILEGWFYKKPVVATTTTGPSGLIKNEKTGILVPSEKVSELAIAINRVITNPTLANRISQLGHAYYIDNFSRDAVINHYINFFKRMIY